MTYPLMDTLNSAIFRISLVELTALEIRRLCSDVTVDMFFNQASFHYVQTRLHGGPPEPVRGAAAPVLPAPPSPPAAGAGVGAGAGRGLRGPLPRHQAPQGVLGRARRKRRRLALPPGGGQQRGGIQVGVIHP